MTSSRVRDGKGGSDPEAVTMADNVDVIVENAQLDFLSDARQEADGVERELELGTRPHERTSDRLHIFATHHKLNGDDAGRTIVRLTQNKKKSVLICWTSQTDVTHRASTEVAAIVDVSRFLL